MFSSKLRSMISREIHIYTRVDMIIVSKEGICEFLEEVKNTKASLVIEEYMKLISLRC